MNRRSFLKTSTLLGTKYLAGATGLASLANCSSESKWQSIHYPKTLLANFRLFDGLTNYLQKDKIVLIEGGRIQAIENMGDLSQYKRFKYVDMNGLTLLPGLIDNHVHMTAPFLSDEDWSILFQKNEQFELNFKNCVMNGVTTVRDVGGFPHMIRKFQEKADYNEIPGPRVVSSLSMIGTREGDQLGWPIRAPYLEGPVKWIMGGNFVERPTTVKEINEVCQEMIRLGANWLKTLHHDRSLSHQAFRIPNHTDTEYQTILNIGKEAGIRCAMHAMLVSGFKKGVELGYHTLEHTPMDAIIPDRIIGKMTEIDSAIIPTIKIVGDFFIVQNLLMHLETNGREYLAPQALGQTRRFAKKILAIDANDGSVDIGKYLRGSYIYFKSMFPNISMNIGKLNRAGAKIGVGTDSGGSPLALFGFYNDELKHLASAGIPNVEVLKMATSQNANILNMQDRIGTIEKGKFADLIAVRGNPLIELEAMNDIRMVMKGGNFIKAKIISGLNV